MPQPALFGKFHVQYKVLVGPAWYTRGNSLIIFQLFDPAWLAMSSRSSLAALVRLQRANSLGKRPQLSLLDG